MSSRFSDEDIGRMITERKAFASTLRFPLELRDRGGHRERDYSLLGTDGGRYRLVLRQNSRSALDFSAILAYEVPGTNVVFRVRRYNGKHGHSNRIERVDFFGFHIHKATERYQDLGTREDAYGEQSDRFTDLESAVRCLLKDCNVDMPDDPQFRLFERRE